MNKGKNHNSIIFLTTLGVYLGLVLVGGSAPHVFAHSATTRSFEIIDEIEVKDDLDQKPDDERSPLSDSIRVYLQDVEYFFAGLRSLKKFGKFDPENDAFEVAQSTLLPCVKDNRVGSYTADEFVSSNPALQRTLELFSTRLTDGYSLPDCLPNERFNGREATSSRFRFKLDNTGLSVEVAVRKQSPQVASKLLVDLAQAHKSFISQEKSLVRQRIYEKTSFRLDNDQVFVITRLPRADLDPLFAIDAK